MVTYEVRRIKPLCRFTQPRVLAPVRSRGFGRHLPLINPGPLIVGGPGRAVVTSWKGPTQPPHAVTIKLYLKPAEGVRLRGFPFFGHWPIAHIPLLAP